MSADAVSTASKSKSAGEDDSIPVKPPINDDDDGHVMNVQVLPPVLQEITGSQVDKSDSDSIMDEIEQHRSSLNARSDEVDPEPEPPVKNESLELSDSFIHARHLPLPQCLLAVPQPPPLTSIIIQKRSSYV